MQPRVVALIGAMGLAAGWLAATVVTPVAPQEPSVERRGPRPIGRQDAPAPQTERLRQRLQEQPRSPSPGRNPFVFSDRRGMARPAAARVVEPEDPAVAPPALPVPVLRRLELSGIASSQRDGSAVLTAILTDNGALLFAQEGERLPGGDTVLRVEESAVVLVDAAGIERTLRLK